MSLLVSVCQAHLGIEDSFLHLLSIPNLSSLEDSVYRVHSGDKGKFTEVECKLSSLS